MHNSNYIHEFVLHLKILNSNRLPISKLMISAYDVIKKEKKQKSLYSKTLYNLMMWLK